GVGTALPYVVGAVAVVWWGRHSDAKLERRFHLAFPLFVASSGIAASTVIDDPVMKMVVLCVAGFGIFGSLPVFWTFPTAFLGGAAAAGGVALVNSIGDLSGLSGTDVVGPLNGGH